MALPRRTPPKCIMSICFVPTVLTNNSDLLFSKVPKRFYKLNLLVKMMKNQLNIKLVFLICLTSLWHWTAEAQDSAGKCAVSVDMVLIGELCILGGLGVRGGYFRQDIRLHRLGETDDYTAKFKTYTDLLPITLATRPTKFSWIHFQFFVDISLLENSTTDEVSTYNIAIGHLI